MTPAWLHEISKAALEQMALSLAAGSALAIVAAAILHVAPRQDARTRFGLWFSVLVAVAAVPLAALASARFINGAAPLVGAPTAHALLTFPETWAVYGFLAWAAIALLGLLQVAAGMVQVSRLRRACRPISNVDPLLAATVASFAFSRPVELCCSDDLKVPTAIGFFRPAVVLPRWLLGAMQPGEINQIVLHELEHLRRRDDWTNLAQKIVKALLFFHPAVWWLESRLTLEREMACDDAVLAQTSTPRQYAECLARLAEKSLGRRGAAFAQAAVSRLRQASLRIARILAADRPTRRSRTLLVSGVAATIAFVGGFALRPAPELIGFTQARAITRAPLAPSGALPPGDRVVNPDRVPLGAAQVTPAALRVTTSKPRLPARATPPATVERRRERRIAAARADRALVAPGRTLAGGASQQLASLRDTPQANALVVTFVATQSAGASQQGFVVEMWQVTLWSPAAQVHKSTPRKSI